MNDCSTITRISLIPQSSKTFTQLHKLCNFIPNAAPIADLMFNIREDYKLASESRIFEMSVTVPFQKDVFGCSCLYSFEVIAVPHPLNHFLQAHNSRGAKPKWWCLLSACLPRGKGKQGHCHLSLATACAICVVRILELGEQLRPEPRHSNRAQCEAILTPNLF